MNFISKPQLLGANILFASAPHPSLWFVALSEDLTSPCVLKGEHSSGHWPLNSEFTLMSLPISQRPASETAPWRVSDEKILESFAATKCCEDDNEEPFHRDCEVCTEEANSFYQLPHPLSLRPDIKGVQWSQGCWTGAVPQKCHLSPCDTVLLHCLAPHCFKL